MLNTPSTPTELPLQLREQAEVRREVCRGRRGMLPPAVRRRRIPTVSVCLAVCLVLCRRLPRADVGRRWQAEVRWWCGLSRWSRSTASVHYDSGPGSDFSVLTLGRRGERRSRTDGDAAGGGGTNVLDLDLLPSILYHRISTQSLHKCLSQTTVSSRLCVLVATLIHRYVS